MLGIEAGERGVGLAHAGYASEVVVDGVGDFPCSARAGGALPRVLREAQATEVVVLVAGGRIGIGVMPAGHAAQGVVGIARGAPAWHGAGGKPVQGVMGVGRRVIPGGGAGSRRHRRRQ